jgi:hypothetical protein
MNRFGPPGKIACDRCQSCFYDFFLLPWPIHARAVALFAAFNARSAKGLTQKWFNPAVHGAASFVASGLENCCQMAPFLRDQMRRHGFVEENTTRCDGLADYSTALKMNRLMLRVAFATAKRSPFF